MNKPYTIVHILSSMDGKVTGKLFELENVWKLSDKYSKIRQEYQAQAWLYGTTTTKEFTHYAKPAGSEAEIEEGDYHAPTNLSFYYVSIDTLGEIGWQSGTFHKAGREDAHVIEVILESTQVSYRSYLKEHGVSYIIAGKEELDCKLALEKLNALFGITKVLICGGGVINNTFLSQDCVDEISIVLAPVVDGGDEASIFSCSPFIQKDEPVLFHRKKVEPLEDDGIWLVYQR